MTLKYAVIFSTFFICTFCFQNCSNHQAQSQTSIEDKNQPQDGGFNLNAVGSIAIDLEVYTSYASHGKIVLALDGAGPSEYPQYCLSNSEKAEVQDILAEASICYASDPAPGSICTMDYVYPYATLIEKGDFIKPDSILLGGKTDGCHINDDLCELSAKKKLKAFLTNVAKELSQHSCD